MIINPDTNARMFLLNGAILKFKPIAAGFKSGYVGKDKLLVSIIDMDSLVGKAWQIFLIW